MDKILVTSNIFGCFYLQRHRYYAIYNNSSCSKCYLNIVEILHILFVDNTNKWATLEFKCYNCKKTTTSYIINTNKTDFKELKVIEI